MNSKVKVSVAALLVSALTVLAGCGGAKPAAEPAKEAPKAKEQVTIRLGTGDSGDGVNAHKAIIAEFEKQNPHIKVQLESSPDKYTTKLLTQIASGTAPDVFQVGDNDIRMFVDKGVLEDLSGYKIDKNLYFDNVYNIGVVNGKLYLLTKDYTTLAVYYNKALFDKAGLAYPKDGWTWNDFLETAKKLTDPAAKQWGVDVEPRAGRPMELWPLQNGSPVIADDGSKYSGYLDSEKSVEGLTFMVDLFRKHKVAPTPADRDSMKGVDLFETGRVAMSLTGSWPMNNYKKNPNLKFGVVGVPQGAAGRANVLLWAGFGVNAKSAHKPEAVQFLQFLTGAAGAREFGKWGLPAVKSVADEMGLSKDEHAKVFLSEIQHAKKFGNLSSPYYSQARNKYLNPALQEAIINGADLKAKLKEIAPLMDAMLKELQAGSK